MGTSETGQPISNKKKKRHSFGSLSTPELPTMSPQRRHRRDWSISSNASTPSISGNPRSQQDEAQRKQDKVAAMEAMFASIRTVSVFSLLGDPSDDPSLSFSPIGPQSQWEAPGIPSAADGDTLNSGTVQRSSPALSQASYSSVISEKIGFAGLPVVHPLSSPGASARTAQLVHVQAATKEIDAMDVDPFYVPLPLQKIRPGISS
jgi:hypothetical protein